MLSAILSLVVSKGQHEALPAPTRDLAGKRAGMARLKRGGIALV